MAWGSAALIMPTLSANTAHRVQALLKKTSSLPIEKILSLHGPLWRRNVNWYIEKYLKWSAYERRRKAFSLSMARSMGIRPMPPKLAGRLADRGASVALYDASAPTLANCSETFRYSKLVLRSTYNAGIFPMIESYVLDMKAHAITARLPCWKNGSWAPAAAASSANISAK